MMTYAKRQLRRIMRVRKDESGAAGVEYAILLGGVGIAMILGVTLLGTNVKAAVDFAACKVGTLNPATTGSCTWGVG